ncbi:MAG: hypothetical protein ACI9CF_001445 [Candidatus Omnitrophota bacterium]|jgi:hypothetical protein
MKLNKDVAWIKGALFIIISSLIYVADVSAASTAFDAGTLERDIIASYPATDLRTYHLSESVNSYTFKSNSTPAMTFYFKNKLLIKGLRDDRHEIVRQYLSEFCATSLKQQFSFVYDALFQIMEALPDDVFWEITKRDFPIIFTEIFSSGNASLANSSATRSMPMDPPTFMNGFWLVKLGSNLEASQNILAIKGVIAHEIAHRYLNHSHGNGESGERAANRLIQTWGLKAEYVAAKAEFGHAS